MFGNKKAQGIAAVLATALPIVAAGALGTPVAAADGAAATVVTHHAYVALVTNKGAFDADEGSIMTTVDASLARWKAESGGRLTFERVGSLVKFQTDKACTSANRGALRTEAASKFPGVTFGGASHNDLVVIQPSCFGSSSGVTGNSISDSSGKLSLSFGASKGTQSLLHEFGHTFGLGHAYAQQCDAAGACTSVEYANDYDIMGYTVTRTPAWVPAAFDTFDLDHLGLGDDTGMRAVSLEPGTPSSVTTVDLTGRGTDAGTRGVKVVDPVSHDTYYLDFRNGAGRDSGAWYPTSRASEATFFNNGVTLEKVFTDEGGDEHSLLQAFPQVDGSGYRYAKNAGETFEIGNVKVEVTRAELTGSAADTATLRITLTDPSAQPKPRTALARTVSGAEDSQTFFAVDVPDGATDLTFRISGGSGDVDLYTRFGAKPSTSSYDCRPYQNGNEESCTVAKPASGTWQVMLVGWVDYANVSLSVDYTH